MYDTILLAIEILGVVAVVGGLIWSMAVGHTRAKVTQKDVATIGRGVSKIEQKMDDMTLSIVNLSNTVNSHAGNCDPDREALNKNAIKLEKRVRDTEERVRTLQPGSE